MESNNIPQYRAATKPAPLTAQTAGMPGKPPKLYTRLHMASPTAPRVIGEPCKRGYAPMFFGKQRMMGWVLGFSIAVVVALSVAIKLVQANVKNEKKTNMAAVEQLGKLKAFIEAVEKEQAVLKTSVAEQEKQAAEGAVQQKAQHRALEQWKGNLAQENKVRTEVEAKLIKSVESQGAAQNEIADLHRKINDMEEQLTSQEQWAGALQDELSKEQETGKESKAKAGKQARTEAEAQLTGTAEAKQAAQNETVDLKRKIKDMKNQLDKQAEQEKALTKFQAELSKEQKARQESAAKADKKALALAAKEKERNALKSRLADMDQQYAAKQEQVKAVAQSQADLKRERELREQTDKRMAEMAAQEKARATQTRDLKDQLQTTAKKITALAEDLDRQAQPVAAGKSAAEPRAVESKQKRGEPESVAATEKKILVQAKGEAEIGATESAQGADKAKTAEASGAFLSAGSEANRHYQAGVQKWDAGDIDGAMAEFKKTISLDSSAAGAYYNIALGYGKKGERDKACEYAYKAGEIYLKNKNSKQATRMVVLIKNIDPSSSLIEKLRKEIAKKSP